MFWTISSQKAIAITFVWNNNLQSNRCCAQKGVKILKELRASMKELRADMNSNAVYFYFEIIKCGEGK